MKKKVVAAGCILALLWGGVFLSIHLIWSFLPLSGRVIITLYAERPQLLLCSDILERLDIVRDWVYEKTVLAGEKDLYSDANPEQFLELLVNNQDIDYGYYCGGIAKTLCQVYDIMGYNACCLDLAVISSNEVLASHVVTLVYVDESWIIEDATFNITYLNESKKHMDVLKLRETFLSGETILTVHGKTMFRRMISSFETYEGSYELQNENERINLKNGKFFYLLNVDLNNYLQYQLSEKAVDIIIEDGYEINEATLYMYPYAIWGGSGNALQDLRIALGLQ